MPSKNTKLIAVFLSFLLIFQQTSFAQVAAQLNIASHLAGLHGTFSQDKFRPLHLRYLSYNQQENTFRLLLDKGDGLDHNPELLENTSKTLLKYFFIGLALPNDSFWVNLRPDSPDNIIDPYLGQTDIGRIMLEADLQLKKDTAQATSPQTPEGKEYWDKLYKKAEELFGYENITIPTLTRPWIVPDEIIIKESTDSAYIYKATLKVMLEQDYLRDSATYNFIDPRLKELNEYSSQLIRELIIPKINREINSAKRYASLRQVYYSLIMAQWFKARFKGKDGQYAGLIDTKNLAELTCNAPYSKDTYFKEYKKSFKNGGYNIKESAYTAFGQVIRSYFSGGIMIADPEFDRVLESSSGMEGAKVDMWAPGAPYVDDTKIGVEVDGQGNHTLRKGVSAASATIAQSTLEQQNSRRRVQEVLGGIISDAEDHTFLLTQWRHALENEKIDATIYDAQLKALAARNPQTLDEVAAALKDIEFPDTDQARRVQKILAGLDPGIFKGGWPVAASAGKTKGNPVPAAASAPWGKVIISRHLDWRQKKYLLESKPWKSHLDNTLAGVPTIVFTQGQYVEYAVSFRRLSVFETQFASIDAAFKDVLNGSLLDKIVAKARAKQGKPLYILDWGAGDLTAVNELAKALTQRLGSDHNVYIIAFGNSYYFRDNVVRIPKNVVSIYDTPDNLPEQIRACIGEAEIDIVYSYFGLHNLTPKPLADSGVKSDVEKIACKYLTDLAGLVAEDGFIVFNDAGATNIWPRLIPKIESVSGRKVTVKPINKIHSAGRAVLFGLKDKGTRESEFPSGNTPVVPNNTSTAPPKAPGGIDFRNLPIVTQAMTNLSAGVGNLSLSSFNKSDLNSEWHQIEQLVNSGITPSSERIKEYLQASCYNNCVEQDKKKVILCISDILRIEEARYIATEPLLRDILIVLESGQPAKELRAIFTGIKS